MRVSSPMGTGSTLPALATGSTETLETSSIASPMMRQSLGAVDQVGPRNIWICRNDPHFATSATLHAGNDPTSWRLNPSFHAVPCFFSSRPRPWLQWQRRLPRNPVLQDAPILTWNHHRWERKHISKFCARNVSPRPNKHEKKAYIPYILQQIIFHAFGVANLHGVNEFPWFSAKSVMLQKMPQPDKQHHGKVMGLVLNLMPTSSFCDAPGSLKHIAMIVMSDSGFFTLCFGHNKIAFARKKLAKSFGTSKQTPFQKIFIVSIFVTAF